MHPNKYLKNSKETNPLPWKPSGSSGFFLAQANLLLPWPCSKPLSAPNCNILVCLASLCIWLMNLWSTTCVSCIAGGFLTSWAIREAPVLSLITQMTYCHILGLCMYLVFDAGSWDRVPKTSAVSWEIQEYPFFIHNKPLWTICECMLMRWLRTGP